MRDVLTVFTFDYGPALRRSLALPIVAIGLLVAATAAVQAVRFHRETREQLTLLASAYERELVPVRFEEDEKGRLVAVADQEGPVHTEHVEEGRTLRLVIDTGGTLGGPPEGADHSILIQRETWTIVQPDQPPRVEPIETLAGMLDVLGMEDLSAGALLRFRDERLAAGSALLGAIALFWKLLVARPFALFALSLLAVFVDSSARRGHGYGRLLRIGVLALVPLSVVDLLTALAPFPWPVCSDDALAWGVYALYVGLATAKTESPPPSETLS